MPKLFWPIRAHGTENRPTTYLVLTGIRKHCLVEMDSDLEAFRHNPADVSFAALAFQLAAFTKNLNALFLSY